MNCGKSTAIIQVAHNYEERGMRVMLIKPVTDTKGEAHVVSRIGTRRRVDILAKTNDNLFHIAKEQTSQKSPLGCILVDEAQFLSRSQVNQLFRISTTLDIPVICYGLRGDFQTNSFTGSLRLFELAHSIEELKTICRCGKKALFNGRKVNDTYVTEGSQVAIDGEARVTYESLCGNCYVKLVGDFTA